MESSTSNRNIGRYDPVAVGKLIAGIIQGSRRIFISGRNHIKIVCQNKEDANLLLSSEVLLQKGYKTFIPE